MVLVATLATESFVAMRTKVSVGIEMLLLVGCQYRSAGTLFFTDAASQGTPFFFLKDPHLSYK